MTEKENSGPPLIATAPDPVIILVDNKHRDLDVAALIAHHLRTLGIPVYLEPLEAFRAVLGAYRPSMIVFNHLTGSQLASWSQRLHDIGVLVGVLPNEGIIYEKEARQFLSGRFHRNAHIDNFFCWNEAHRETLIGEGYGVTARLDTVGVPRFDFYFEPWSHTLPPPTSRKSSRPRILFCTNFQLAYYYERPAEGDAQFKRQSEVLSLVRDYKGAIDSHWRSQKKVFAYLDELVSDGKFDVLLRPHPTENRMIYDRWIEQLPADKKERVELVHGGSIAPLILDCDLEISCEVCTTAMESWIAEKRTIELIFDRHPMLFNQMHSHANIECDKPAELPDLVAKLLAEPLDSQKKEERKSHLAQWVANDDGKAALRIAQAIAMSVRAKKPSDWTKLDFSDFRRSLKLKFYRMLGHAYHYDLLLKLKSAIRPLKYRKKTEDYAKSIMPADAAYAIARLKDLQ